MSLRFAVVVGAVIAVGATSSSCITLINPVQYRAYDGSPVLEARPDGCAVELFDENTPMPRTHKIMGRVELSWSAQQAKEQGAEGAIRTLKAAICEHGGHALVDVRALQRGFKEGFLYEADLAVLVDENGEPVVGRATGTSSSSEGLNAATPAPAAAPSATP